jgi:hypothetical protein
MDAISTTDTFGAPVQLSSSHAVIEPSFDGPNEGLPTVDFDMTLIACDEDLDNDVFSSDCISNITDLKSLADESTIYEVRCSAFLSNFCQLMFEFIGRLSGYSAVPYR